MAQLRIENITAKVNITIFGQPSIFILNVVNSDNFLINASYGDGNCALLNSSDVCDWLVPITSSGDAFAMTCKLRYLYPTAGKFKASFNVSNYFSWQIAVLSATVEPGISGVNITTTSSQFVTVGYSITVTVTLESGEDVQFSWDFGDDVSFLTPHVVRLVSFNIIYNLDTPCCQVGLNKLVLTLPVTRLVEVLI